MKDKILCILFILSVLVLCMWFFIWLGKQSTYDHCHSIEMNPYLGTCIICNERKSKGIEP